MNVKKSGKILTEVPVPRLAYNSSTKLVIRSTIIDTSTMGQPVVGFQSEEMVSVNVAYRGVLSSWRLGIFLQFYFVERKMKCSNMEPEPIIEKSAPAIPNINLKRYR